MKISNMKYTKATSQGKLPIEFIDIRDLLTSQGLSYRSNGKNVSSGWIGVNCPWCDDSGAHLGINLRSKTISCWKCGKTGTIISYLSKELNSFNRAMEVIRQFIPTELKMEKEMEKSGVETVKLPDNALPGLSSYHRAYLEKRRFNPDELIEKFNMHHVGPVGEWARRIIIPVIRNYRLVTFTSIEISDDSFIRYKHLSDDLSIVSVKELLFGSEFTDKHSVIVVEGIFDFFRMGDGSVPTFGTKFTGAQKRLLAKYNYVKIVGDGDSAGWKLNRDLGVELAPFCNVKYFNLASGVDPDTLTDEEIRYIKRS